MRNLTIKNEKELKKLLKDGRISKIAADQISNRFATEASRTDTSFVNGRVASAMLDRRLRDKRSEFCLLPEFDPKPDPAVLLYRACVKKWGRHYEGGLVVWELVIKAPRPFRVDVAIPKYKIAIELDGFVFHSSKESIAKDHEKTEQLSRLGWITFKIGVKRTLHDLDSFLSSIQYLINNTVGDNFVISLNKAINGKLSFHSTLVSWGNKQISEM